MMHGPPEVEGAKTQINHLFDSPNPDAAKRPTCVKHWWPVVYEVEGFLIDICSDCHARVAVRPAPEYHDEAEADDAPEAYEDATDSNHPFP